jgi:hypothetical protein
MRLAPVLLLLAACSSWAEPTVDVVVEWEAPYDDGGWCWRYMGYLNDVTVEGLPSPGPAGCLQRHRFTVGPGVYTFRLSAVDYGALQGPEDTARFIVEGTDTVYVCPWACSDVNRDGETTVVDATELVKILWTGWMCR